MTDIPLTITASDEPLDDAAPYRCEICGDAVPPTPSGRKPRLMLCEEHRKGHTPRKGTSTTTVNAIVVGLEDIYRAIGLVVTFAHPADGQLVALRAHDLAESWRPLLEQDARLRKWLSKAMQASGWGSVLITHALLGGAIAANHYAMPDAMRGVFLNGPLVDATPNGYDG